MKLSVRLQTYNHEEYILESIQGVVAQQTNFDFELVIGDDFSTDNTKKVVQELITAGWSNARLSIRLLERSVNDAYFKERQKQGRLYNFVSIVNNCKGEYVALLDGDDYWNDPLKLQRQVDFLEKNKDFGGVANNALVKLDNGRELVFGARKSRSITVEEIIRCRQFATASVVFRNNVIFPKEFTGLIAGDTPLMLLVMQKAPIYYENTITSVYRKGAQGVTANFSSLKLKQIEYLLFLDKFTNNKYSRIIRNKIRELDSSYYGESSFKLRCFEKFNHFNDILYKKILSIMKLNYQYYYDIDGYPFYKKIYFRIFG